MQFNKTSFLLNFLHEFFFSCPPKKLVTLITWSLKLLPTRVRNSISFLVVSEWRLVPDSNLAELLSRLIFRYFTYIFTFFFWCFFIYYLPMYFTWLLIFILPFYLINLFHSYITLTSFLIKIFWLRFSGIVFYDFTFDLRREMIEHPKNFFDCYLTIKSGLYFACIHDFFIIWEYFVTSKHTLIWFLQTVLVFVYWHYKLLTSTFIFIIKNLILLIYWLWGLKCGHWYLYKVDFVTKKSLKDKYFIKWIIDLFNRRQSSTHKHYYQVLDYFYPIDDIDKIRRFMRLIGSWTDKHYYHIKMDTNFSLYSFFYNTSLLLFAKLREVQVVYIGNKVVLLHALNFRNLKMLTIPQGFSLEIYMYSAAEYKLSENEYALYWFTRTSFTLTRNNFLGFKVLLSEEPLYNWLTEVHPSLYKVDNNKKVYLSNLNYSQNTEHLRIFNLRFNYALLNIFKSYLKEVLTVLTVNLKLTNFILVLNRNKCISWSNQDIYLFVDNIEVLIYDKQRYFPRKPSFIEGVQYIFGSNTTLTSQTYYRPRSNQEFSIIFAEPRDLLRFLNYQVDYSYSAALREDDPSII